ncbi:riboflavin synthase domain-like protein [Laetiporus sulphureus 93-53]|uniref:NADPH-dependent diflavin oxidoreductase 1 n=1 Tax=Laetiporus sulphureus 93-53 TaxID=1314785 RepID=A0A165DJM9_9APHY|nr:riboflavin synthase domain-like protein [Laetiporus sulphureus 93-53]KZT05029.1 riboflavin synthase domain-like protein [Laetiporus sulphureus 93-53]
MSSPSEVSETDSRTVTILYATETGTAQEISDRIAAQCRRIHIRAHVHNMDTYSPQELISEGLVIFSIATTGSGREPRAMTPLWNMLLRSDLPEDLFEDLSFAVFGLGDTAYEKFCWPAKLLSRRLASLGATEVYSRGEGDEQHPLGIDGAFEPWIKGLLEAFLQIFPLPTGLTVVPENSLPPPRVAIRNAESTTLRSFHEPLENDSQYHLATVSCNRRITAQEWYQDVRHFEFDFDHDIQYEAGDVAIIHPEVASADVESFLATIGFANAADDFIIIEHTLEDQSLPDHLPRMTTLRQLFTRYLDIGTVPRRSFFAMLRHFVANELEAEKIDEFLSVEGADELYDYCQQPRRTIREVLEEFRSARIPRDYIFDLFPPLRPRQFSIASSVKCRPRQVHLCVAIVVYRTRLKVPRRGVCTRYMANLRIGDKLWVGIQKGLFSLPPNNLTPIICVGPGTGVASMRAIIEERTQAGAADNTLYFGCRSAAKDQHYGTEWAHYAAEGLLTYRTAFSRDVPEGAPRRYVQDVMREDSKQLWDSLGIRGAWMFISGSANKMPAGVRSAIREAAQKEAGKTEEEAEDFLSRLEREGRLWEECWS